MIMMDLSKTNSWCNVMMFTLLISYHGHQWYCKPQLMLNLYKGSTVVGVNIWIFFLQMKNFISFLVKIIHHTALKNKYFHNQFGALWYYENCKFIICVAFRAKQLQWHNSKINIALGGAQHPLLCLHVPPPLSSFPPTPSPLPHFYSLQPISPLNHSQGPFWPATTDCS